MNLKELACPIRIYWDLPVLDNSAISCMAICQEIVEMKFFTLDLRDTGAELSKSCIEILERLKNEPVTVTLTVSHSVINPSIITRLSELRVKELLVDAFTGDDFHFIAEMVRQYKSGNMTLGASLQVNKDNYRNIPDIVSFCLSNNMRRIVFPMQRLTVKDKCFYIGRQEGKALTEKLNQFNIDSLKLTIHDPFLWRIFFPEVAFPGAGCQAGNSMAYISHEGNVYPCPSMPVVLGDLNDTPLKSVLLSACKKELVKSLRKPPRECLGCGEIDHCIGGCRGRTLALKESMDLRDPACN